MFSPVQARQTSTADFKTPDTDFSTVYSYAYNNSGVHAYKSTDMHIKPIQIISQPESVNTQQLTLPPVTKTIPVAKPVAHPIPTYSELEVLVTKYAAEYGANKDIMLFLMRCESGNNPSALNGPFAGLYQFMSSTWISNRNAMGLNPDPGLRFNAEEAIKTAAYKMGRDGYGAWPACSTKAFNSLQVNQQL